MAVRDLGAISKAQIVEVFKRINATKYALTDIETNNAVYAGAFKKFAESISSDPFFIRNNVFTSQDFKRMGDLRYAIGIIVIILSGYTNRDDAFEDFLDRFNDDFPEADLVKTRLETTFNFITECGFDAQSRIWRKADLFTAIVEIDRLINLKKIDLQPSFVVDRANSFFSKIDISSINPSTLPGIYYKATVQASNDRVNRVRRGLIFAEIITGGKEIQIQDELFLEDDQ